ncbi:MAG: hypothetical protein CME71_04075 [Halobacteriovorax sp.]|nr:hypothetical protein [Halobacteriovorax sp.]
MAVTKFSLFYLSVAIVLIISQIQVSLAEMMPKGKTKFKFLSNIYHQNGNDGTQVADNSGREEANVFEPMIFIETQISEHTAINADFVFDAWSAASDTKLDGFTGASGKGIGPQTRISGNFGLRQEYGSTEWHAKLGFSSEYDYRSFNGSVGASKGFAQDNFTLGLDLRYFADAVKLFQDITPTNTATISDYLPRQVLAISMQASQILTIKDIVQLSLDFVRATNNLESTASTVVIGGVREVESLPDSRARYSSGIKWVHGVGDSSALHLAYRHYFDQWGLSANSISSSYFISLRDDLDLLEFSARYHQQSQVDYFAKSFDVSHSGFKTSDSDLEDFDSYELGTAYAYTLGDQQVLNIDLENIVWDNGVNYAIRSNGLRYAYWQSSIGFEF